VKACGLTPWQITAFRSAIAAVCLLALLPTARARWTRRTVLTGLAGLTIGEATVKGVVKSQGRLVAMLQAPDNKTYIIHTGDKMLDGVVKAITTDSVVFAQDVNDPLSLVKQREVRKMLRAPEEGK